MASDKNFVDFILDQIDNAGHITFRKMFGEYAIYLDAKVVALICDNRLFVKPTEGGRIFIGNDLKEAPAYSGAKNSFLIGDKIEDKDWLTSLIKITAQELPEMKPKKTKKKTK